jgi:hypothetical protein
MLLMSLFFFCKAPRRILRVLRRTVLPVRRTLQVRRHTVQGLICFFEEFFLFLNVCGQFSDVFADFSDNVFAEFANIFSHQSCGIFSWILAIIQEQTKEKKRKRKEKKRKRMKKDDFCFCLNGRVSVAVVGNSRFADGKKLSHAERKTSFRFGEVV